MDNKEIKRLFASFKLNCVTQTWSLQGKWDKGLLIFVSDCPLCSTWFIKLHLKSYMGVWAFYKFHRWSLVFNIHGRKENHYVYTLWTHFIDIIWCFQFHMVIGHFRHLGKCSNMNERHTTNSQWNHWAHVLYVNLPLSSVSLGLFWVFNEY